MSQNEDNVLRGAVFPIKDGTAGEYIFESLLKYQHLPEALINAHTGTVISYKTVLQTTCVLAESLKNCGFGLNSVITICSENNAEFLFVAVAGLYIGATVAPLNEAYTEYELTEAFTITEPDIIFCSEAVLPKILKLQRRFPKIRKIVILDSTRNIGGVESFKNFITNNAVAGFDARYFKPTKVDRDEHVAFIMCSSGTTGLPKGVMLTHKNIVTRLVHCRDPMWASRTKAESTVLNFLPLFHTYALSTCIGFFFVGIRTVLIQKFDMELFLRSIQNYKVESVFVVPAILLFLAKSPMVTKYDLSSLYEMGCGASPLPKEIEELVIKRLNLKYMKQGYGLTEGTFAITLAPPECYRRGTSGRLVPHMSAKIVDPDTRKILGPHQKGEICLKGNLIMKGYNNNPEATRNTIDKDGWLSTGDIGYYDEDGYFYIESRLKELIKYNSFQVPPAELDALLFRHPKVDEAVVFGIPDEKAGELPAAFVVPKAGHTITEKEIQDYIANLVSPQKWLRGGVKFLKQIPKTATGKFQRKKLAQLFLQQKAKM